MGSRLIITCDGCGIEADAYLPRGEQQPGPGQAGDLGRIQAGDPIGSSQGVPGLPPNWIFARVIRSLDTDERVAIDVEVTVHDYTCLEKAVREAKKDTAGERGAVTKRNG